MNSSPDLVKVGSTGARAVGAVGAAGAAGAVGAGPAGVSTSFGAGRLPEGAPQATRSERQVQRTSLRQYRKQKPEANGSVGRRLTANVRGRGRPGCFSIAGGLTLTIHDAFDHLMCRYLDCME
jgi:hypothetical protein